MVRIRADVSALPRYVAGRSVEDSAAEYGLAVSDMVKLASNESPFPPLPPVVEALGKAAHLVGRYPDDLGSELTERLSEHHGVAPGAVWLGAGSSAILRDLALAVGGPGTSAVYAWPSFVIYRLATRLAGATAIEVPLDPLYRHDLPAMMTAIGDDTTVVYVCNPNNPTGTTVDPGDLRDFIASADPEVLVVVDEAYAEYVTEPGWSSSLDLATDLPNVVVTRTFSKIYGLADLRVGYAVGHPDTISELRRVQAPFTVSRVAQAAAQAALACQPEITQRARQNAEQRAWLEEALSARGVQLISSQANFVMMLPDDAPSWERLLGERGIIVRRLGDAIRVTVGTADETRRVVEALDSMVP